MSGKPDADDGRGRARPGGRLSPRPSVGWAAPRRPARYPPS